MNKIDRKKIAFSNILTKKSTAIWVVILFLSPWLIKTILHLGVNKFPDWVIRCLIIVVFILFTAFLLSVTIAIYELLFLINYLIIFGEEKYKLFNLNIRSKSLHSAIYYTNWNSSPINYILSIINVQFLDINDIIQNGSINNYFIFSFLIRRLKILKLCELKRMRAFLEIKHDSFSNHVNFNLLLKIVSGSLIIIFTIFAIRGVFFLNPSDLDKSKSIFDMLKNIVIKNASFINAISLNNLILGLSCILIVFVYFPILYLIDRIRLQNAERIVLSAINIAIKELS